MVSKNLSESKTKIELETVISLLIVLRRYYGNEKLSEIEKKVVELLKELKIDGSSN